LLLIFTRDYPRGLVGTCCSSLHGITPGVWWVLVAHLYMGLPPVFGGYLLLIFTRDYPRGLVGTCCSSLHGITPGVW